MEAKKSSWWQKIRKPLGVVGIIAACVLIIAIIGGYRNNWEWTGLGKGESKTTTTWITPGTTTATPETTVATETQPAKTLWDWLGLIAVLAIPVVVGLGAAWFSAQQGKVSDRENKDNQRERALQGYIDKMSDLLLEKHLRESVEDDEVRNIARVRTLTVLSALDGIRRGSVLQFLYESGLINKDKCIIDLLNADLRKASLGVNILPYVNLSGVYLSNAYLVLTNLNEANLSSAILDKANLFTAKLYKADLREAYLVGAKLTNANLDEADLREADLREADLSYATLIGANLSRATLSGSLIGINTRSRAVFLLSRNLSYLSGANLNGAIGVTVEELEKQAKSLKGATMPDGSIHP